MSHLSPEEVLRLRQVVDAPPMDVRAGGWEPPPEVRTEQRMQAAVAEAEVVAEKWGSGYWSGPRSMR